MTDGAGEEKCHNKGKKERCWCRERAGDPRDPNVGRYMQEGGGQVRISECLFNLIGVHPCRGAGEPCREATAICTNYTRVRQTVENICTCVECKWFVTRRGRWKKGIMRCFENMTDVVVRR